MRFIKYKLPLEIILLTVFVLSGSTVHLKIPFAALICAASGSALAMIYFYLGLWVFEEADAPRLSKMLAGGAYSIVVIATLFCFLNWPGWFFYGIASFIALAIVIAVCLFKHKSPAYKSHLYRALSFLVAFSIVFVCRYLASP
jgi:hypothetical protein